MPLLEIRELHLINALHRALVEAKFHRDPNDALVPSSPLVADIANRVADLLEVAERDGARRVAQPGRWREPHNHPEKLEVVRLRVAECEPWPAWDADAKRDYLRVLLAPLRPEPAVIDELLAYGDSVHGGSS